MLGFFCDHGFLIWLAVGRDDSYGLLLCRLSHHGQSWVTVHAPLANLEKKDSSNKGFVILHH